MTYITSDRRISTKVAAVTNSGGLWDVSSTNTTAGLVDEQPVNSAFFQVVSVAGLWHKIDFGSGNAWTITSAIFWQSTTATHGTWKWQGSNDNTNWTDVSGSFTLGGATVQVHDLSGNSTAYRYYRCLGVSGTASATPFVREWRPEYGSDTTWIYQDNGSNAEGSILTNGTSATGAPQNALIDGNTGDTTTFFRQHAYNIGLDGGCYIRWDFGRSAVLTEAKFYEQGTVSQGVWQFQGSADGSSWTNVGSTFTLNGSGAPQVITTLNGNTSTYRYWRILGISGFLDVGPYVHEFQFDTTYVAATSGIVPLAVHHRKQQGIQ